ncbi:MAG: hypothetical protein AAGI38_12885 [Bacteroidota bacterium]
MKNTKRHPYMWRLLIRERLPWWMINLGIADKGEDCEKVNAEHVWYNGGDGISECYLCKVTKKGELWRKDEQ